MCNGYVTVKLRLRNSCCVVQRVRNGREPMCSVGQWRCMVTVLKTIVFGSVGVVQRSAMDVARVQRACSGGHNDRI